MPKKKTSKSMSVELATLRPHGTRAVDVQAYQDEQLRKMQEQIASKKK